jgi:hypothetical protein
MSTAVFTQALLEHCNCVLFDHSPYSPDLALSNYHPIPYLKNWLQSQHFNSNEELMEGVKTWLSSQTASIQKIIPRYDKCLNSSNDYVEK